jgi:site-specific DNA-methyltransferase (adenine-specific)
VSVAEVLAGSRRWAIEEGEALDVLEELPAVSVDAVVTDPPYGLGFMGREWDTFSPGYRADSWPGYDNQPKTTDSMHTGKYDLRPAAMRRFQARCGEWAAGFLRVAKPGAHLVAFGGTRTSHRLVCALEDAGWEIRDSLMWIYGSGFPKSYNLDGDWEGWGTALKPGHEPIVLARKPLVGGCRVEVPGGSPAAERRKGSSKHCQPGTYSESTIVNRSRPERYAEERPGEATGRWPPNVLLTHSADCYPELTEEEKAYTQASYWEAGKTIRRERCAEGCPVREMDEQSGELKSGTAVGGLHRRSNKTANCYGVFIGERTEGDVCFGDSGGASRFFPRFRYEPKASSAERNAGLEGMPDRPCPTAMSSGSVQKAGDGLRGDGKPLARSSNHHPTVKPVALMRWLCRLVTPPGGVILDPFLGSGSTMIAALQEGFRCIGIEREAEYVTIARRRVEEDMPLFNRAAP